MNNEKLIYVAPEAAVEELSQDDIVLYSIVEGEGNPDEVEYGDW